MNKKKIKLIVVAAPLIILISALSGCIAPDAIQTKRWEHANDEGTAVTLYGFLKLGQNFHDWDGWFVYDTEFHDNYENYNYRVEADSYDALNFFSVTIDGLDRNTEYHYRAFGEHKQQGSTIRVGVDRTFIPGGPRVIVADPSDIGITSAVIEGRLTHMGGADSCEVFFRYGEDKDFLDMETDHQTMTSIGDFNFEVTGLSSCKTYHYRAYAKNDADTWMSSTWPNDIRSFTPGMPIVETFLPKDVTTSTAKFHGKLFGFGGTASSEVWFEYGDENPNNLDETSDVITMDALGEYYIDVEGLNMDTTYWVRAVGNNGVCEHKGEIKEFKTLGSLKTEPSKTIHDSNNIRPTFRTKILSYLSKRFNLDEISLESLIEQYPVLSRIMQYSQIFK